MADLATVGSRKGVESSRYVPAMGRPWLTPFYDIAVRFTIRDRTVKEALLRQAGVAEGHQILDLACGTGTLAIWIKRARSTAKVTGVDADEAVLRTAAAKAQRAGVRVRIVRGMSDALPFPASSVDRVLSSLFFHHLTWDEKVGASREAYRVLRPGGQLHVADWGRPGNLLMRTLFLPIQLLDGFRTTRDNLSGRLGELFEGTGFVRVKERRSYSTVFGTMTLYSAERPGGGKNESAVGRCGCRGTQRTAKCLPGPPKLPSVTDSTDEPSDS